MKLYVRAIYYSRLYLICRFHRNDYQSRRIKKENKNKTKFERKRREKRRRKLSLRVTASPVDLHFWNRFPNH